MRSEQEIFQLIHECISRDDNIRATVLNGSRANPNVKRDPFQDFDVACLVRDVHPYLRNSDIIRVASVFVFEYPQGDDDRVSAHLRHVQELPRDASEIY